jgi:hypothetical protein
MNRVRLSTTVDPNLLKKARESGVGTTDAELIDAALSALLSLQRSAEIDAAYADAYAKHPIEEPDDWGDLASFREAASQ